MTQFTKMTQGNFEIMSKNQEAVSKNQEVTSKNHEASIKNLKTQTGQLFKQLEAQSSGGLNRNTMDNPMNESCKVNELRNKLFPTLPSSRGGKKHK